MALKRGKYIKDIAEGWHTYMALDDGAWAMVNYKGGKRTDKGIVWCESKPRKYLSRQGRIESTDSPYISYPGGSAEPATKEFLASIGVSDPKKRFFSKFYGMSYKDWRLREIEKLERKLAEARAKYE
jgi:hypothetical protein